MQVEKLVNPKKPHASLSNTDWLTDAVDAETGMDLVWFDGQNVQRAEIIEILEVDNQMCLSIDSETVYPCEYINAKKTMVVE